ncbi:MAG TPA: DUF1015 family protein [Vicinamibacterales bacterium]|jgi:uncharacterized protein (DUF1015 family)|nr:DUF1015 family protein [Vicinamibacterales bacterium]
MSAIFPFAALRPAPEVASRVASVPYDVVSTDEARALAAGNPLSFLRVSRSEIDLPEGTDPHDEAVYQLAAENFAALKDAAPLVLEETPRFYVYRLHMGAHVQTGVAACFSLDEYDRDQIRKHEKTRPDKEDDRTRHMLAIGAQTGPVFLAYQASAAIDAAVARVVTGPPLFDFTAPDDVRHVVWRVPTGEHDAIVGGFGAIPVLYIADGHHRAASAARARRAWADRGPGEWDRVLAVAFPDNQVQVLPYNRVVRDLNGQTPEQLLEALGRRAQVRDGGPATPAARGSVAMRLGARWYTVTFPATDALDVDVLEREVLAPLFGITDVRIDTRIEFVGGIRGAAALERLVASGGFAVAFSMFPVSVADLMRVADAGGIMPPKSTWFEPKLRDGLLSHLMAPPSSRGSR